MAGNFGNHHEGLAMRNESGIHLSFASCLLACTGDFIVTFTLGFFYPGYSFVNQTESYLGTGDSPVAFFMNAWGLFFCFLLILFSRGLRKTIFCQGKWQTVAVLLIALYGLGEGAGSGLFPYNHTAGLPTMSAILHDIFGAVAGLSIALVPLVCTQIFSKSEFPALNGLSYAVFIGGLGLILVFLLSKAGLLPYKGLWQRVFILNYHAYLVILGVCMIKGIGLPQNVTGKS